MKCRKDCYYYGKSTDTCDFYLITSIRRGCSSDNCTRYRKEERKNILPINFARTVRMENVKRKHQQMLELYNEGKTDREIAAAMGYHRGTVTNWRRNTGLISQKERQKKLQEAKNHESKA